MKKAPITIILLVSLIFAVSCKKKEKADEDLPAIENSIHVQWVKTFAYNTPMVLSTSLNFDLQNFVLGEDGDITIVFTRQNTGLPNSIMFIKMDSEGNIVLEKELNVPMTLNSQIWLPSLIQTSDNGYLINYKINHDSYNENTVLVKTDESGDILWIKNFNFWGRTSIVSVLEDTGSNGYFAIGLSDSLENFILKLNSSGDTVKSTKINSTFTEFNAYANGYSEILLSGAYGLVPYDFNSEVGRVICIDTNANFIWSTPYISTLTTAPVHISALIRNDDNSYTLTGGYGGYYLSNGTIKGSLIANISPEGSLLSVNYFQNIPYGSIDIEKGLSGEYLLVTFLYEQIAITNGGLLRMEHIDVGRNFAVSNIKRSGNDYILFGNTFSEDLQTVNPVIVKISITNS